MTTHQRTDSEIVAQLIKALLLRQAEHQPQDPESDTVAWVPVLRSTTDD